MDVHRTSSRRLAAAAAQDQCTYECSKAGYHQGGRCLSNTCQCLKEVQTVSSIFESMLGHQCEADGQITPGGPQYRCKCPSPLDVPETSGCYFHIAYQGGRVARHMAWYPRNGCYKVVRRATFCLIWNSHLSDFWSAYPDGIGKGSDENIERDIEELSRKLYSNVSDEQFGENLTQYCARWLPIPYGCVQMVSLDQPKPSIEYWGGNYYR